MNRFTGTAVLLAGLISLGAAYIGPSAADDQYTNDLTQVSVYFPLGITTLTKEAGTLLDETATTIKAQHSARLVITGYAGDGATTPDEQRIAEARATAVGSGLVQRGVDAAKIRIGIGQSAALGQSAPIPNFIADRRTDIVIEPAHAGRFDF